MIDDYDEYDDFDPMDDDETSADYYITQVIEKTGVMPKDKIIKALEDSDWDIGAAIKLLKAPKTPAKPVQKPSPTANNQTKQNPQKKSQEKATPSTKQPEKVFSPTKLSSSSSISDLPTLKSQTSHSLEEQKSLPLNINQDYPDINFEK